MSNPQEVAVAPPATADDLLTLIMRSGLIPRAELDRHLARWRECGEPVDDSRRLALLCINDNVLTRYQVANLLRGKWKNFIIGGKYKLLDLIGSGGMGQVFLCEHVLLRRRVALKVLPTRRMTSPAALDRFLREARAIASLDHPNIIRAFDLDRDGAAYFMVLEYVEGLSLQQLVGQIGSLAPEPAAHYIAQAASGLQHAHEAGWVHRDIKPNNLLLDRQGVVKVLDLGLARLRESDEEPTTGKYEARTVLGTADYLSPEQAIDSHNVDIQADIYSLGATLYFLLSGRPPFAGGTMADKLEALRTRTAVPIRELRPDVPRELAAALERMMARNKADRMATPEEVVESLLPLIHGIGPFPPPPALLPANPGTRASADTPWSVGSAPTLVPSASLGSSRRLERSALRRRPMGQPWLVGLAAGLLLASGVLAGFTFWNRRTPALPIVGELPLMRVLEGHSDVVESVAFSVDGTQLITAGQDRTAIVWNVETGAEVRRLVGHSDMLRCAAFSPDGRKAVTASYDGSLRVWDLQSGKLMLQFGQHEKAVSSFDISRSGRFVVSVGDDCIGRVWDLESGSERLTLSGHNAPMTSVAILPDDRHAVTASLDRTIRLWNLATGEELRQIPLKSPVWRLDVSSDGIHAAFGVGPLVKVWRLESDSVRAFQLVSEDAIDGTAFTPDDRAILSAGHDGAVRLWDVCTGRETARGVGHSHQALSVACSPDGKLAASGGRDHTIRLWRMPR